MRHVSVGRLNLVALMILSSVGASSAQVVNGSISGSVLDPSGAVVLGAEVMATNTATGTFSSTASDGAGLFRFAALPVGNYHLEVTKEGFRKYVISGVRVSAGVDYGVGAIALSLGPASEVITVAAAPPLVERTEAQISTSFSSQILTTFAGLQENYGLDSLALLLPGVNNTRDDSAANQNGVGFSVNGLRGRSNDQQIDGQNNNDPSVGGPNVPLSNPNFVQEYEIVTNNFGPEYGRNSGAVVNLVTPSGTNEWHGRFVATESNSALDTLANTDKEFLGLTKPQWFNDQFTSTTIGGPVRKNRIFIFGGFDEEILESTGHYASDSLSPTPNGLAELASCFPGSSSVSALRTYGPYGIRGGSPTPLPGTITDLTITGSNTIPSCNVEFGGVERTLGNPTHWFDFISRADFQWTNDRVYVRYIYNYNINIDGQTGAEAAGYPETARYVGQNALVGWTHLFSPQMTNQLRIGYGQFRSGGEGNSIGNTIPSTENVGSALANIKIIAGGGNPFLGFGPPINQPQGGYQNTYQIQDAWNYVHGKSQWKAGVNFTDLTANPTFLPDYNGAFSYASFTNTGSTNLTTADCTVAPGGSLTAFAAFACNVPTSITVADGNPTHRFHEPDIFLFIGNDYRAAPNLTLNLGLTWSFYGQPMNLFHDQTLERESNASTAFWNPNLPLSVRTIPKLPAPKNNWGPNIGLAWSPNWGWLTGERGETVLRGGYRLAFDPIYYNIYDNVLTSAPELLLQTLTGAAANANPLPAAPFGPRVRGELASSLTLGVLDPRTFNQTTVSPNLGPDRVHSWSFGIQRKIRSGAALEIRYVGNHGQNLFQAINANPFLGTAANPGLEQVFPNYVPPGVTDCTNSSAPGFGRANCNQTLVRERTNTGNSDYNGLQMQFRTTKIWDQLTVMSSYTWSKTTDNVSELGPTFGAGTTEPFSQNPLNYTAAEHGDSGIDFPQVWTVNFYEEVPAYESQHGISGHILGGWAVTGNYILSSGQPYSPVQGVLNYLTGGVGFDTAFDNAFDAGLYETARPFLAGPHAPVSTVGIFAADACSIFGAGCALAPNTLLNFNVLNAGGKPTLTDTQDIHFIVNGAEAQKLFDRPYGNAGRNSLRDAITNLGNFALIKTTRFRERANLEWHITMLNVFNHSNYSSVDPFVDDAGLYSLGVGFATPSVSYGGTRTILFGVKFNW